jgi:hypothetical protein
MPNFNKSKGFQLRSGNKAKAPFKMMGSSPAKNEKTSDNESAKRLLKEKNDKILKLQIEKDNKFIKDAADKVGKSNTTTVVKEEEAPKPKHRDQVKKAEKITKLEGKEAKRDAKRADGKKVFLGNLKKKNNANKREKLQTEVDKTSEQYVADKAAKSDARNKKASEIMIGTSKMLDPNSQFKSLAEQEAASATTERKQQNIEDYKTGKYKDMELNTTESAKGGEDVNLEKQPFVASHEKV